MSPEIISILALVAMFVVATLMPVNMGALAFVAAFLVGTLVAGMTTDDILATFPGDLFVTLVGITYLFAIAQNNGTITWLVNLAVRAVRGRIAAIPWVMFGIGAVLTAIGAASPAAVAIVAPVALGFAARYRISPLLMGLMVVHGAQAGGFSPISIYGGIVNDVVDRSGLPGNEVVLFLASLLINTAIAILVFVLFGGRSLVRRREEPGELDVREPEVAAVAAGAGARSGMAESIGQAESLGQAGQGRSTVGGFPASSGSPRASSGSGEDDEAAMSGPTPAQMLTVFGLLVLTAVTLLVDVEVGLVALTVAVLLGLTSPQSQKQAVAQVSWPVVLLICGMLTYVGVLEEMGTIDFVGNAFADVPAPLLAALLLCFLGGIVSAFASSVGIMGALIPLAVPFLQQGEIGAVGMIAALAVSSTVVDCSPFSTNGALVLANAQGVDKDRFFRQLMTYGAVVVAAAPVLIWLLLVVPGWF